MFSGQMAQYIPEGFRGQVIADFVDVDSAKFEAYAQRDGGLRSWAQAREARLLRRQEARIAERADVSLLISDEEAELFRHRLPGDMRARASVRTLSNGIDSRAFDPSKVAQPAAAVAELPFPRLIFTGQMDYAPNIDACVRTAEHILPLIRKTYPHASFHVVGRNPPERLSALHMRNGVHVWGRVPEVQPWLAAADLALVPLQIGRGVQNKVLEAMAMSLPVVLTPEAATGIRARDGTEFVLASNDAELAQACIALLDDPARSLAMAEAARRYVVAHASWQAALAPLTRLVGHGSSVVDAA